MQTIIIKLNSEKLQNPDLDLCYRLPDRIEEVTKGVVQDNGYDYITDHIIGIWLRTDAAVEHYPTIIKLMKEELFLGNDLSLSAEILISQEDTAEIEECKLVYPT